MDIHSFLQKIEAGSKPDLSSVDSHWAGMKNMLIKEGLFSGTAAKLVNPLVLYLTVATIISLCVLINTTSVQKAPASVRIKAPVSNEQKPTGTMVKKPVLLKKDTVAKQQIMQPVLKDTARPTQKPVVNSNVDINNTSKPQSGIKDTVQPRRRWNSKKTIKL